MIAPRWTGRSAGEDAKVRSGSEIPAPSTPAERLLPASNVPFESLRNPGGSHSFIDAVAAGEISRVVAAGAGAEAADREARFQRQPSPSRNTGFVDPAEMRQCCGEREVGECEIPVGLDSAAKPRHRFFVLREMQLGGSGAAHPVMGCNVAGAESQRLAVVALGLLRSPKRRLSHANQRLGVDSYV